jgi:hypothetical protein
VELVVRVVEAVLAVLVVAVMVELQQMDHQEQLILAAAVADLTLTVDQELAELVVLE